MLMDRFPCISPDSLTIGMACSRGTPYTKLLKYMNDLAKKIMSNVKYGCLMLLKLLKSLRFIRDGNEIKYNIVQVV